MDCSGSQRLPGSRASIRLRRVAMLLLNSPTAHGLCGARIWIWTTEMIELPISSLLDVPSLEWAHPLVREWFVNKFGTPTEPQEQGWPHILAEKTTLICAPTGSGKTLAAFLACIDRLVRKAVAGELDDRTEVLYVS